MKNLKIIVFLFCVVTASAVTAQNIIPNQYSIGCTGNNGTGSASFDNEGNYYLFTSLYIYSSAQDMGTFNALKRGESFLVISKYNENHNQIWCKSYGGDSSDRIGSIVKVQDGFLICGSSNSPVSGTKTIESNGFYHIWLQKVDFDGEILWQKGYYTNSNIGFASISEIGDNKYLVSAQALTGVSGDKTSIGYGGVDGWLLKIDEQGNIIWDVAIGTEQNDSGFGVNGVFENGDILILNNSPWGISGVKTENNFGDYNYWFLRISSETGEIVWDKTIGSGGMGESSGSVILQNNTIYMVASSTGGASGLRTLINKGIEDIWFVRLNENGEIQDQKCFGGSGSENSAIIKVFDDYMLLLIGSNSNMSFDKNENTKGLYDIWFLKLDLQGNILQQKTIGGSERDFPSGIAILPNGNYLISSSSFSNISGDKTTNRIGLNSIDTWMIELDAITLDVKKINELYNNFIVYPNPSFNECNIAFDEPVDLRKAILYDNSGRIVLQKEFQSGKKSNYLLNVSSLAKGNYTLVLEGSDFNKTHQLSVE